MSIAVAAPGTRTVTTSPRRTRTRVPNRRRQAPAPLARPAMMPSPGRTRALSACAVDRRPKGQLLLTVKVALVSVVALLGVGVSAAEFVSWSTADPSVEFVQGDPAWAHVEGR